MRHHPPDSLHRDGARLHRCDELPDGEQESELALRPVGYRHETDAEHLRPGNGFLHTGLGVVVNTQYDVTGAAYWIGLLNMPGTCTNGVYTISGQNIAEINGSVFFSGTDPGVYKSGPGHATFFFPQYSISSSSDLGSLTSVQGMTFDSYQSSATRNVAVSSNSTGTVFTVQLYANAGTGTMDTSGSSWTDTITITHVNTPQIGMMTGTVTRTGTGAGSSPIACIVNKSLDTRVICAGESPASPTLSLHRGLRSGRTPRSDATRYDVRVRNEPRTVRAEGTF